MFFYMAINKYEKSVIYILACRIPRYNRFYIGGTLNLKNSLGQHSRHSKNKESKRYDAGLYEYIRESGGIINWTVEPLEFYNCKRIDQLDARVNYWRSKRDDAITSRLIKDDGVKVKVAIKKLIEDKKENYYNKLMESPTEYKPKTDSKLTNNWYELNKHLINKREKCNRCDLPVAKNNMKQHQQTNRCSNIYNSCDNIGVIKLNFN